jgi:DNA-binding MarR family transcriptional regulator
MVARNKLTTLELRAWGGFLRTHASVLRQLDDELQAAHGLPLTSFDVLVQLDRAPDHRLRMRDLAEAVVLSRSGLTRLVDRLERQGLVQRVRCSEDQRGWFAVLTERGAEALRTALPTHVDGIRRRFLAELDEADMERLGGVWERVLR